MPRLRDVPADELGPYLRQHRDNPVEWYTWDDDAFARARETDRPILLSVGYSSCHWCHVMAHESFEDDAVAAVMNEYFVNIKVDREERPDVDAIYMQIVLATTGRGGWPMTVFLDPDGRPFYGGTYFPPAEGHGMPSFTRVLQAMHDVWTHQREKVTEQGSAFQAALVRSTPGGDGAEPTGLDPGTLEDAVRTLLAAVDPDFGGFGGAPKFPAAMALEFLVGQHARTPSAEITTAVTACLDAMAAGGIHDQIGGGFARYSVDAQWLVPHFEKMLYDQALLLRAYTAGWRMTRHDRYAEVAAGIVRYVLRDLGLPDGGFASAEDADSEGVEGKFYCWSSAQIHAACGADAPGVIDFFGVTEAGNFHDPHTGFSGSILHRPNPDRPVDASVRRAVAALLAARSERVRPGRDEKVLLAWNALFTRALFEAAATFGQPEWHAAAVRNLRFLTTELVRPDGRYLRSWQRGHARHLAVAEDYAALLELLITAAELDDPAWLVPARKLAGELSTRFADPNGPGFFTTGTDAPALIARMMETQDNATPSENSLAANALFRLAALTGESRWELPARAIVERFGPSAARHPQSFAYLLAACDRSLGPAIEVAIAGSRLDPAATELARVVSEGTYPGLVSLLARPDASTSDEPLLIGRTPEGDIPAAYVCEHFTCRLPITDPATLRAELESAVRRWPDRRP